MRSARRWSSSDVEQSIRKTDCVVTAENVLDQRDPMPRCAGGCERATARNPARRAAAPGQIPSTVGCDINSQEQASTPATASQRKACACAAFCVSGLVPRSFVRNPAKTRGNKARNPTATAPTTSGHSCRQRDTPPPTQFHQPFHLSPGQLRQSHRRDGPRRRIQRSQSSQRAVAPGFQFAVGQTSQRRNAAPRGTAHGGSSTAAGKLARAPAASRPVLHSCRGSGSSALLDPRIAVLFQLKRQSAIAHSRRSGHPPAHARNPARCSRAGAGSG